MLAYNRIDISEGIDVNKTSASKDCDICHFWHFKDVLTMNYIFAMVVMFNEKSYEFYCRCYCLCLKKVLT